MKSNKKKGGEGMNIFLNGNPKEIAALVLAIQKRREINDPKELVETIRHILLEESQRE